VPTSKDRPGQRDDDTIWLLERLAGVLHSQGKGTDAASLPRGGPVSDIIHYLSASHANAGTSTEIVLQLPTTTKAWELVAMTYHRTAGTATAMAPRVGQAAAFAAGGPDDRVQIASQAVTAAVNVVFCSHVPFQADANGRAYFRPGFNAGADNDGTYQFWFKQGILTEESTP